MALIHGHARTGDLSPTWRVWEAMRQRCNCRSNKNYGGRGITVCDRWGKYLNFLADMGERPEGMQLDRIDNDAGYSKENCRWATPKENSSNTRRSRRFPFQGKQLGVLEISEITGLKSVTIWRRIYAGWPLGDAFGLAATNFQPRSKKSAIGAPP